MENTPYYPFLKQVALYVNEHYKGRLQTISLVFPNKRARVYFNKYLAELNEKPVFSPRYFTISEYILSLGNSIPADQFTLIFTLFEVYKKVTSSPVDFDNFLFYCEMLLADFDDIDKYLVNPKSLYRNLADLKEIEGAFDYLEEEQLKLIREFWETFSVAANSPEKQKFESIWMIMSRIYEEFNAELDKQQLSYEGKAYRQVMEGIQSGTIGIDQKPLLFVGFNALSKIEHSLFKYLKSSGIAEFFWDTDAYYMESIENHEAARFLKDLVREFPHPKGFRVQSDLRSEKTIEIIDIPTQIGQAKALSGIIQSLPEAWKSEPSKTAIALADESLLLPVLTSLPESIGEVNVSMGFPVKHTLSYSLIGILLDLHKNKKVSESSESYFYADVFRLLQHSFIQVLEPSEINNLIKFINRENIVNIKSEQLTDRVPQLKTVFRKETNPRNFIPLLLEILEMVSDSYLPSDKNMNTIEREAQARITVQLNRMADVFANSTVEYSFQSLARLTGTVLKNLSVPFSGEPLTGVQVMGVLETRTLDFENLIVLSMNEGVFPKTGHVPTLIPYSLRKAFGLPTVEHQDSIFAYYFYRLLQRARYIKLVYCSSVIDSQKGEASRFIHQLLFEKNFKAERKTLAYKISPQHIKALQVKRSAAMAHMLLSKYSGENANTLSPSAINTYLNCQLRFYYRYIAGIPEPEEVLEDAQANTLGSILHGSMKLLYDGFKNRTVTEAEFKNLLINDTAIENAVIRAFWTEFLAPKKDFPGNEAVVLNGKNLLVKEVIIRLVKQIIRYDAAQAPFTIRHLEEKFDNLVHLPSGQKIRIGGTIDRIDEFERFSRIIDYKTGEKNLKLGTIENLFDSSLEKRNSAAFQILLYSLVYKHKNSLGDIVPNLFFVQHMLDSEYDGRLLTGSKPETVLEFAAEVLPEFEPMLQQCLSEMFSAEGFFHQTTVEKRCSYCPYAKVCGKD